MVGTGSVCFKQHFGVSIPLGHYKNTASFFAARERSTSSSLKPKLRQNLTALFCTEPESTPRLAKVVGRSEDREDTPKPEGRNYARERLKEIMEKEAGRDGQAAVHKLEGHSDPDLGGGSGSEEGKPSVNERLKIVLNKPRERLESDNEREVDKERVAENEREIDREIDRDPGLSH